MITLIKAKLKLAYLFVPILNFLIHIGHEDFAWRIMLKLQKWGEKNGL